MADVDAARRLASEHDLEFVNLDNYGVDPTAGEILPADLARRHHMVAIKRKFGTPVIAIADPADADAHEAARDAIGRDYISVVAVEDQIKGYIDRLFGGDGEATRRTNGKGRKRQTATAQEAPEPESFGRQLVEIEAEEVQDVGTSNEIAEAALHELEGALEGLEDFQGVFEADEEREGTSSEQATTLDSKGLGSKADLSSLADALRSEDLGLAAEVQVDAEPTDEGPKVEGVVEPASDVAAETPVAGSATEASPATSTLDTTAGAATEVAPGAATEVAPESAEALTATEAEGAAAADVHEDAEQLADLVTEAVATYEEQHGEGPSPDQDTSESAMFPPLAKALVGGDRVSAEDMRAALDEAEQTGQNVAHVLMAKGLVTESDLMWGMAQEMGLEFVDLDTFGINFTAVGMLPEATARHHKVIVISEEDGRPVVATSNPTDVFAMDDLRTIIGRSFKVVVSSKSQIVAYIDKAFDAGADEAAMEASIGLDNNGDSGPEDIEAVTEEAPIVRYVNLLILQALNERASDIHIEPTGNDLRIRYRIDGVLHDVSSAPRAIRAAVTARLKVMADMNIAEHRVPQDGRISLNVGAKSIDLRMATLPTINGEKVVMRVLDKSSVVMGFSDLGFDDDLLERYEGIYTKPYGTLLVTGPTGSGKSTTLYTTLTALNSPEKNIITVEDPVELPLKGISQIQLNPRAGLTFASALRAILRSDPDIVLVGEIRDKETAVIAIEAALTGHLVLSTLHTNNAASTPMRLIEMGLEPFLVTSALTGVLAQRLARRLCVHCKEAYEPTEADIVSAGWTIEEVDAMGGMTKVYRSVGCSACSNTGYRGRKALAEFLPMTEEVERMIIEGGSMEEIHRLAVSQGMVTLRQSGLRKALEGETTLEEVLRVVA